jgi:phosphoribosylamine--glycine ligase
MKILIVGNGGREHALLWRLAQDRPDVSFLITRGTPGTKLLARSIDVSPTDVEAVLDTAAGENVDLTVVGPEVPLAAGLADRLTARGLTVFGPLAQAAKIESSKVFAKQLMKEIGVPTADFETFTELEKALDYLEAGPEECVVKTDGLASGKGSIVCRSKEEARKALRAMMEEGVFGSAGSAVVIEEFMEGEELSLLALVDGRNIVPLAPSQDHKAVGEGDTGPNTGGMGAYAPVIIAGDMVVEQVVRTIMQPVVDTLAERGCPYRGCLYAGLMLTGQGPRVVEFNCRFGDPETQAVLPLLDGDLVQLMMEAAAGSLAGVEVRTRPGAAVCVVLASRGYPASYEKGKTITFAPGLEKRKNVLIFHAGTSSVDSKVVTSGGRVLGVTGLGADTARAVRAAYAAIKEISFDGMYYRSDIAYREINRLKAIQERELT